MYHGFLVFSSVTLTFFLREKDKDNDIDDEYDKNSNTIKKGLALYSFVYLSWG